MKKIHFNPLYYKQYATYFSVVSIDFGVDEIKDRIYQRIAASHPGVTLLHHEINTVKNRIKIYYENTDSRAG